MPPILYASPTQCKCFYARRGRLGSYPLLHPCSIQSSTWYRYSRTYLVVGTRTGTTRGHTVQVPFVMLLAAWEPPTQIRTGTYVSYQVQSALIGSQRSYCRSCWSWSKLTRVRILFSDRLLSSTVREDMVLTK
jgi:hypothetical protein